MIKLIFAALILTSINVLASSYAPVFGDCSVNEKTQTLDFPTGTGSLFPKFDDGTYLSVFVGPSENLAKDEKGVNLFDLTIDAYDENGNGIGTHIFRHLTANPVLKREFAFDLMNGTIVNCKF